MCNCRTEKLKIYKENDFYTPEQICILNRFLLHNIKFCPFCGENLQEES